MYAFIAKSVIQGLGHLGDLVCKLIYRRAIVESMALGRNDRNAVWMAFRRFIGADFQI